MPDLGDLAHLVKDEGYQGEFFEPTSVESLAKAIENIVTNDAYRIELGKINYKAATALPMSKIADMYLSTFEGIISKKGKINNVSSKEIIL
jgi:glycosyltransferase involved in cell wall biosynthesis